MLGEPTHRSSFIRSKPTPEESRAATIEAQTRQDTKGKDGKLDKIKEKKEKEKKRERRGSGVVVGGKKEGGGDGEEDGFTMSTLL